MCKNMVCISFDLNECPVVDELGILPSSKGLLNGPLKFTFNEDVKGSVAFNGRSGKYFIRCCTEQCFSQADRKTAPEGLLIDRYFSCRKFKSV